MLMSICFVVVQKVELCRCLYKLHFQLLQLFEGYSKLVNSLAQATKPPQVSLLLISYYVYSLWSP